MITARAQVVERSGGDRIVRRGYRILDGEHEGIIFVADPDTRTPIGSTVTVRFHPDDQFAREVVEAHVEDLDDQLVDSLEFDFWQGVAAAFPQIKTGDLDPIDSARLKAAMRTAITAWLNANEEQ